MYQIQGVNGAHGSPHREHPAMLAGAGAHGGQAPSLPISGPLSETKEFRIPAPEKSTLSVDRHHIASVQAHIEELRDAIASGSTMRTIWWYARLRSTLGVDSDSRQTVIAALSERGPPILNEACEKRPSVWLVRGLLRLGFDPSKTDAEGNSSLHSLARSEHTPSIGLLSLLLSYGATLTATNKSSECPLSILAKKGQLSAIARWQLLAPRGSHFSPQIESNVSNSIVERFTSTSENLSAQQIQSTLDVWQKILGEDFIKTILRKTGENGLSIFHRACLETGDTSLLSELISRGADVNQPIEKRFKHPRTSDIIEAGARPLHIATILASSKTSAILIESGADQNLPDGAGDTPMLISIRRLKGTNGPIKLPPLRFTSDILTLPDHLGTSPIEIIFSDPRLLHELQTHGLHDVLVSSLQQQIPGLSASGAELCLNMRRSLPPELLEEFERLSDVGKNIEHAVLYLLAAAEAKGEKLAPQDRAPLAKLLPHLLNFYPAGSVNELIKTVPKLPGWDVELMALLNHPRRDPKLKDGSAEVIVQTFQRLSGGELRQRDISWTEIRNWARIGTLAHSFTRWKYETVRAVANSHDDQPISLLEHYGFERIPDRYTDRSFGPGFLLRAGTKGVRYLATDRHGQEEFRSVPADTIVEFRRGYLMISTPFHGNLIIRNSSPLFGRDSLTRGAYYYRDGITPKRKISLSRKDIEADFAPVGGSSTAIYSDDVSALLDALTGIMQDFAAWKFDTRYKTAWYSLGDDSSSLQLAGGHYSPGFAPTISAIKSIAAAAGQTGLGSVPELAFIDPEQAPWAPFDFLGSDNTVKTRLSLDARTLNVLERLSRSDPVSDSELTETGVRQFLQEAGLKREGELVLLTPAGPSQLGK